ncbi:MAG: type I secretion system permease/ATPase [Trichloromonas sp.]|jgi:subfamily B ATP-binding cassette protein HlyB/CyaB|nr:type I secretion system permease/ATPase [Trichloromonas sp.]
MNNESTPAPGIDTGLACLVLLARFFELPADGEQLRHEFGRSGQNFGTIEILRAAKHLGLKAGTTRTSWTKLNGTPLPAVASRRDGRFAVLAKVDGERVLLHDPAQPRPTILSRDEFGRDWDGGLILFTRRAGQRPEERSFDFSWFIPAIVKYRKFLGEVLLASFFLQLFALLTPLFFQVVVDKVLVHKGLTTLQVLGIGMIALALFEVILSGLRAYLFAHTTSRIDVGLGAQMFRHLLRLPLSYFEARRVGDSIARVRELENIRNFLTSSSVTVVIDLFFTVVFLAVMFYYSPLLTWIVVGSLPCYILLSLFVTPRIRVRLNEKFNRGAENQAFLVESVTGIETVKAMAVEPAMQRRWEEQLAGYVGAGFRAGQLNNVAGQIAGLVNKLTTIAIVWAGAYLVMDGKLTIGQLVAFNMLAGRVSGPVLRLVQLWQEFQQAGISVQRIGDILNTRPEPAFNPNRATLPAIAGQVVFDRVDFRYRPDTPEVLRQLSLQVSPGQTIGLVGRSGSGKSTITKLIQRLYVPESGRVLIDGVDLAQIDPTWLRRQIGVVLQENFLFNRSVRENIALADPAIPMERVIHAAQLAGAHDFILEMPQGYDTLVGEHGCSLSGGQRQRIAIARALVTNPRILIFDEATSALDYESEHIIQQNMARIRQGRTVIIIAHRLSTVRACDRIFVIDKGRIVESGGYQELLRQGGAFAQLHRHQEGSHAA